MTTFSPDLFVHLSETLGHTLLHSLWQGSAVAIVLAAVLKSIGRQHAQTRYVAACLALIILPCWMAGSFAAEWNHSDGGAGPSASPFAAILTGPGESTSGERFETSGPDAPSPIGWHIIAAVSWLFGAGFFLFRLAAGWRCLRRLRKSAAPVNDPRIRRIFAGVCDRLAIRERVALLSSNRTSCPQMSGFLWPAVVLPAGMLSGVPAVHLQSILAHELAHFRRWDYAVNLAQSLIEALLFYHPATWWISRQIRVERENACDDVAAALPGNDFRRYAGALAWLEENRIHSATFGPALAMARDRRDTLSRIGRLGAIHNDSEKTTQQPCPPKAEGVIAQATGLAWILLAGFGVTIASASSTTVTPVKPVKPLRSADFSADSRIPDRSVFRRCETGRQRAGFAARLVNGSVSWERRICDGVEVPLFKSAIVLEKSGKLYNLHKENPRLFPEFPNRYLLDNELNFLDGGLPSRDPDGDGFTNLEEYGASTDPNEAGDHPDYVGKLQFISRHARYYRITFAARPDDTRFQLNRHPSVLWDRKTMMLRMGEITGDGHLRLDKLTDRGLEATWLPDGARVLLPKRERVEIPTWFARMRLALPAEKPFYVEQGKPFRLSREPDRILQLDTLEETGAGIIDPQTGESWTVGSTADPEP